MIDGERGGVGRECRRRARERSEELFQGKEADVFRHTYWHALMIIDGMPTDWVAEFGEQWEIWPGNSEKARLADLQNNAVGRRVGAGVAGMGFDPATAMKKAEILAANMVRNHGADQRRSRLPPDGVWRSRPASSRFSRRFPSETGDQRSSPRGGWPSWS